MISERKEADYYFSINTEREKERELKEKYLYKKRKKEHT
jgi:hypothetical protein